MTPAKHHDRIAGSAAVGARAQSPPDAKRIDDRHPCADVEQPLDKTFRRIGLARAGGADDRDPVIERVGGRAAGRISPVGSAEAICALLSRTATTACVGLGGTASLAHQPVAKRFLFMIHSLLYSRKPPRSPDHRQQKGGPRPPPRRGQIPGFSRNAVV
jgi:hypothetical protein